MTTAKRPEVSKGPKKSKQLSLNKKTLKDLAAKGNGPVGAASRGCEPPSGCSMENSGCV